MLVEHRVDDVDEGLVAVEQAVAAGEEIALEPALALVLGENLHHPPGGARWSSPATDLASHCAVGRLEDRLEAVGGRLVWAEEAERRRDWRG